MLSGSGEPHSRCTACRYFDRQVVQCRRGVALWTPAVAGSLARTASRDAGYESTSIPSRRSAAPV